MPQSSLHFFSHLQVWVQNTALPPAPTGGAALCGHRCGVKPKAKGCPHFLSRRTLGFSSKTSALGEAAPSTACPAGDRAPPLPESGDGSAGAAREPAAATVQQRGVEAVGS